MALLPLLVFIFDRQNTTLMFILFIIPFLVSLKISYTNNYSSAYNTILSMISKLTIAGTFVLAIFILIFFSKQKSFDDKDKLKS